MCSEAIGIKLDEFLEAEGITYAIRLPANAVLYREIDHLMRRPVGRSPAKPIVFYHRFEYQAGSWNRPRTVVAKVEWYRDELFPRVVLSSRTCAVAATVKMASLGGRRSPAGDQMGNMSQKEMTMGPGLMALCILSLAPATGLAVEPPTGLLEPVTLVLWDFETEDELDVWNTMGVEATLSSQWVSRSKNSVRLVYGTKEDVSDASFRISADHYDFPDFGDYETFALEAHNPGLAPAGAHLVL